MRYLKFLTVALFLGSCDGCEEPYGGRDAASAVEDAAPVRDTRERGQVDGSAHADPSVCVPCSPRPAPPDGGYLNGCLPSYCVQRGDRMCCRVDPNS